MSYDSVQSMKRANSSDATRYHYKRKHFRNPLPPEKPQEYPEMWADFEMLNEKAFNSIEILI